MVKLIGLSEPIDVFYDWIDELDEEDEEKED